MTNDFSILIIQTCNPDLLAHVVNDARGRFPDAFITVLFQRGMRFYLPAMPCDEQMESLKEGRRELIRSLRTRRFDLVCFVESGEPGFWKLKLLPLLLRSRSVWVYDRLAQPTPLGLRALAGFLRRRLSPEIPRLTGRRLLAPVTFCRLWRFHRRRTKK